MVKKRFNKRSQVRALSFEYIVKILLIIIVVAALFYSLWRIGNAFLPK